MILDDPKDILKTSIFVAVKKMLELFSDIPEALEKYH